LATRCARMCVTGSGLIPRERSRAAVVTCLLPRPGSAREASLMADRRAEWSRTIREWFADPEAAAWIRERSLLFLKSGTSPQDADPEEGSFACAVVDVLEWRRAHFASSGVRSGPSEAAAKVVAIMATAPPSEVTEGFRLARERAPLWKWNRLRLILRVEGAYRKTPWPEWLVTAVEQVRTDLRRAGLIETVAVTQACEPTPGEIHLRILQVLEAKGKLKRSRIWTILGQEYGRDALRDAIDEMHEWGYVKGPKGARDGVAILDKGRAYLRR
jgi:hypothetical protein